MNYIHYVKWHLVPISQAGPRSGTTDLCPHNASNTGAHTHTHTIMVCVGFIGGTRRFIGSKRAESSAHAPTTIT